MYVVVLVTCQGREEGERIASVLLKGRLAACVNIVEGVESHFWWADRLHKADEALLLIKTKKSLLRDVIKKVKSTHQYENPEIIAIPIIGGSKEYMKWIEDETQ